MKMVRIGGILGTKPSGNARSRGIFGEIPRLLQVSLTFLLSKFLEKTVLSEFRAIFLLLQDSVP